ncbi:hypothetical protein BDN72DRAFT_878474 [Pluteus cervinus]|uniref:Uncharacterized protein n=1 Tax=Pluteus cervinus TaxID=181527 RepID=A0ACD3AUP0_9AGAR|nr:hypothetical protein BDN72DRAFT_878474 [Pluteus cervinus]
MATEDADGGKRSLSFRGNFGLPLVRTAPRHPCRPDRLLNTMSNLPDHFTFTVGKLDAGMAILLGERAHLIEFPSILLPPGATTGSIVNIAVHQNHAEEKRRDAEFWELQDEIAEAFGVSAPSTPELKLRNVTQTSVTLEWPHIELATAKLRSLDIYRNGQRLATIPSPMTNTSTKLSGLEIFTDYSFQLVLRTTAGTYPSNVIQIKTHNMANTSGISVCFGNVQDSLLLENAKQALRDMKAKWSDKIQIDTTHFVCTTPAATPSGAQVSGNFPNAPGVEYQRALQLSIPIVQPQWILACHGEKKMIPIAAYYLGATPAAPMSAPPFARPQSMSQASLPRSPTSPAPPQNRPPAIHHPHTAVPVTSSTNPPAPKSHPVHQKHSVQHPKNQKTKTPKKPNSKDERVLVPSRRDIKTKLGV